MTVSFSDDQVEALERCLSSIERGRETVLVGPAGSGKSFLMRELLDECPRRPHLACPTGKAARRLSDASGRRASTIHKLMYSSAPEEIAGELVFKEENKTYRAGDLLVIDEASMLGLKLYQKLMRWVPPRSPVLFVGDAEQLEPVKDVWGPNLKNPTAALTTIHRQALESPIIVMATAIRQGEGDAWFRSWDGTDDRILLRHGSQYAIDWYLDRRSEGVDVTLLTFTHIMRRWLNNQIRLRRRCMTILEPGDRLLIRANRPSLGLMNGDVVDVTRVEYPYSRAPRHARVWLDGRGGRTVRINTELLERPTNEFFRWFSSDPGLRELPYVHAWYGDCLTVHSSQGSQWDEVGYVWCHWFKRMRANEPDSARRFLYTAVTRAADRLAVFAAG